MKKSNILVAVFAVLAAASIAKAEANTVANLAGAGDKIASIDMNKDYNKAGGVLNDLFSGSITKKDSASAEAAVTGAAKAAAGPARNIYGQTAEELSNAKGAKIGKLSSAVKPLAGTAAKAGAKSPLGQNKSTWWEDAQTVGEYVGHVGSHAVETWDAINAGNGVDPDEHGIVVGTINTIDAIVNP